MHQFISSVVNCNSALWISHQIFSYNVFTSILSYSLNNFIIIFSSSLNCIGELIILFHDCGAKSSKNHTSELSGFIYHCSIYAFVPLLFSAKMLFIGAKTGFCIRLAYSAVISDPDSCAASGRKILSAIPAMIRLRWGNDRLVGTNQCLYSERISHPLSTIRAISSLFFQRRNGQNHPPRTATVGIPYCTDNSWHSISTHVAIPDTVTSS